MSILLSEREGFEPKIIKTDKLPPKVTFERDDKIAEKENKEKSDDEKTE